MKSIDRHRAAHEAFNSRDWEALRACLADDMMFEDHPRGLTMKTADEFLDWCKSWCNTMSDAHVTEATYYDAGATSVARFTGRGTNDGAFGPMPATGRRLSFEICELMHWGSDGKIASGECLYDQMTIMVQLGVADPPPPV